MDGKASIKTGILIGQMTEKALIIIPTYDERENVAAMSEAVLKQVPEANILFVDDNSPDGTGALLDEIAAREPRVFVMHRAGKEGLGRAYIAGFKWALARDYALICEMDCDFSHDPAALPSLLQAASGGRGSGAGLALHRRHPGDELADEPPAAFNGRGAVRAAGHRACRCNDPTGGFKCFRRAVLQAIDLDRITSSGYSFQIEMTHTAWMKGFKIKEVPIVFRRSARGLFEDAGQHRDRGGDDGAEAVGAVRVQALAACGGEGVSAARALPAWLRALRPAQWIKNGVVPAAYFFARWDPSQSAHVQGVVPLLLEAVAVACFCSVIKRRVSDQRRSRHRSRPGASRQVPSSRWPPARWAVKAAVTVAAFLLLAGMAGSLVLPALSPVCWAAIA